MGAKKKSREEKLTGLNADIIGEKREQLKQVAPEIFSDGKVDVAALERLMGADGVAAPEDERYRLEWAGKRAVFDEIAKQSHCTLTLDPEQSRPRRGEGESAEPSDHLFIEGENLEVLRTLQKAYHGKVKMIYIDPPYNTGKDFVYHDNFRLTEEEYCDECNVGADGYLTKAYKLNSRDSGRFHSNWLSMMYPRLYLARNLLRDDGVLFVSIDDNEVHNLRLALNEIFGEDNFITEIVWEKRFTRSNNAKMFASLTERLLVFRKNAQLANLREPRDDKSNSIYSNPDNDPRGPWTSVSYVNPATKEQRPNLTYKITNPINQSVIEHPTRAWKYEKQKCEDHIKENRLYWGTNGNNRYPRLKKFYYLSGTLRSHLLPRCRGGSRV